MVALVVLSITILIGSSLAAEEPDFFTPANGAVEVMVAAYEFPPYYSSRLERHLLGELLELLNQHQSDYEFSIHEVRPQQRYHAISEEGCCSVLFFESARWGWAPLLEEDLVTVGPLLTEGSDHYVRLQGRQGLEVERIGGVVGYHYNLVGYQSDQEVLENDYNLYLADTHRTLINMLLGERLDMIMLSAEYLSLLRKEEPDLYEQFMVLDEIDQEYRTRLLLKTQGEVSLPWMQQQLVELYEQNLLEPLFASFGMEESLLFKTQ